MPGRRREELPPDGITAGITEDGEHVLRWGRWSWLYILFILGGSAAATGSILLLYGALFGFPLPGPILIWAVGVVVIGVIAMLMLVVFSSSRLYNAQRQDFAHIESKGYKVCIKCRYDLSAHAEKGVCPECCRPYHIVELQKSWEWTYRDALRVIKHPRTKNNPALRTPPTFPHNPA